MPLNLPSHTTEWSGHPSPKRQRLTSYEHATRVAKRIFDATEKPVIVVYVGNAMQQFQVISREDFPACDDFDSTRLVASYL